MSRAMRKKIVFLPYDFDTAIGINNEGSLTFSYNLEDIDKVNGTEDVFNGQDSVLWKNVREMFFEEIKSMYQTLRSQGKLSYDLTETAFEEHQEKWPEALFNEDSWFKYLAPLEEKGSEAYLAMLQGSKAEQRKWWLYNRFRYLDSKYNAGDALTDVITLRGYAKSDITITPYADVYASIKYGSYLVQERAARNTSHTLECPLDNVNDTEIYIYSASQLANVGDLSGLKVGYAEFAYATRLQEIKLGDSSSSYNNGNLQTLYLGNNTLLKKIDVRNCSGLGTGDQKTVDISGCSNIEEVYFEGTNILGVELPNGGFLKKLHLPGTITNLTIRNQTKMTEFVCDDFSNVTTLFLENTSSAVDIDDIIDEVAAGCRVRLFNFYWEFESMAAVNTFLAKFDGMIGMDQNGNNTATPQIYATVHVPTATGDQIDALHENWPYIVVDADVATFYVKYYSDDGNTLLYTETVTKGSNGTYSGTPSKTSTAQYSYSFVGWSLYKNSTTADSAARNNIQSNRNVYAAYTATVRTYTVTFVRANADGGGTLLTLNNVAYGTTPSYTGSTPTSTQGYPFNGWTPELGPITGNTTYTAVFRVSYTITFVRAAEDGGGTLLTLTGVEPGTVPVYTGSTPTTTKTDYTYRFTGWTPTIVAANANATYTATFVAVMGLTRPTIERTITIAEHSTISTIGNYAFFNCSSLATISFPAATNIGSYAFYSCYKLTTASFSSVTSIGDSAFCQCNSLTTASFPVATTLGGNAFAYCYNLTTIFFPSVTSITSHAFDNCSKLTEISFPVATNIGNYAFSQCTKIETVSIPAATRIGNLAFARCYSLKTASFPSVTSIGNSAFSNCYVLTTALFPVLTHIGPSAFINCYILSTVSFPAVKSIGSSAFYNCHNLTTLSFPVAEYIGKYAFALCSSLTALILASTSKAYCENDILYNANSAIIYVNDSLVSDYKTTTNWSQYSSRIKGITELYN